MNLEGVAQDDHYLYMFMDFVRGGELFTYLRSVNAFPIPQAQFYAAQIVTIFDCLHSKDVIYRYRIFEDCEERQTIENVGI